ncbi:hypothetical protein L6Q79_16060 [bacterium]|nr:hypothetical protein [bacterium]
MKIICIICLIISYEFISCCCNKYPPSSDVDFIIDSLKIRTSAKTSTIAEVADTLPLYIQTFNSDGDTARLTINEWYKTGVHDLRGSEFRIKHQSKEYICNEQIGVGHFEIVTVEKDIYFWGRFSLLMYNIADTTEKKLISGNFYDDDERCVEM